MRGDQKDLIYNISGPRVFVAIINHQQQLNDSVVRVLIDKLKSMKVKRELVQNVETFAHKILELAKRIEGSRGAPNNLTSLVAKTFVNSKVMSFNMEAICLHTLVNAQNSTIM